MTPKQTALAARAIDALQTLSDDREALRALVRELAGALEAFERGFADFERWPTGKGYSLSEESLKLFPQARAALTRAREVAP